MKIRNIRFRNNIGRFTESDIYYPALQGSKEKRPFVLLLHGFRAFKDWGFFPYFAQQLADAGYFAGTIDFSLNKLIDKEKCLFDMDSFSINTVTQEITEANTLLEFLLNRKYVDNEFIENWNGEIYLIGHSLGGALAIMVAGHIPAVTKLVTICSIYDFDIYTERQKNDWLKNGFKKFTDSATNQTFILDVNFLLDRLTYVADKSVTSVVSKLNIPYYIIHTEADATVSPKAATILAESVKNKDLLKMDIIQHGNHLLNVEHPFTKTNPILENIINSVIIFFDK